jgi:phage terminase large subunit-like protein
VEQITLFPNARNDDQADMMSQASAWLMRRDIPTVQIYNAFTGQPFD